MRIAIPVKGEKVTDLINERFGRSENLLVYDEGNIQVIQNQAVSAASGAGVKTSQLVSKQNIDVVIALHVGPKAFQVLEAADIRAYQGVVGTVAENILAFNEGRLKKLRAENDHSVQIAIPTDGSVVAAHFGRCQKYTVFAVEADKAVVIKEVENPGHEPGYLPKYLAGLGITGIIASGMGSKAQKLFKDHNIEVTLGCQGQIEKIIAGYLNNNLVSGENSCVGETEHHCQK